MRRDYISMSDGELERLSEMRDAKGRLTDVAKRAKHTLWLRYHNEECGRKCNSYVTLDFYDGERDDRW